MRSPRLVKPVALAVAAVLFLVDAAPAASIAEGAEAPNVAGIWINHETTTLKNLRGYAVLVEFWATWCGPCMVQIPHVNELWEKYKGKGLMIVAVSDEGRSVVEKCIADKGMKYPIALDPAAGKAYGVSSIPHSFLVSPEGKVLWSGHPANLKESLIEKAIETATFIPPLPEKLARFNAPFKAKKFGKAYLDLKKAVQEKKATAEEVQPILQAMESRMKGYLDAAVKAKTAGDFYVVGRNLNELKTAYVGTDQARQAADLLKEVEKDAKAREQIKASDTIEKLERAMEAKAFVDAYKGYKSLAKKHAGTTIEKIANEKLVFIDKEKLLSYKPNCPECKKRGTTCPRDRSAS